MNISPASAALSSIFKLRGQSAERLLIFGKMAGVIVAAWVLRILLDPVLGAQWPFILFFPALMLVTWRWGIAAGVLGLALSSFCAAIRWLGPEPGGASSLAPHGLHLILYMVVSGLVIGIIGKLGLVSRQLAVSERRYRSLVRSTGGFVWITDAKGVSQVRPDQWERVTGRSDYQQGDWAKLIDPEDLKHVTALFREAGVRKECYTAEFRMIAKDGSYRWFATRAVPILDGDGSILEWVGLTYDIDPVKTAETKLEAVVAERTAQLKATIEELESFSYSVSHDLRGPLRVMQSFAEALAEDCGGEVSATAKDYVRRIVAAADRMDCVIQDVLVYSRMTRGELPLEPVALDDFISALLDGYPGFKGAKADVRIEEPLPTVVGNKAALTQALANLIGNALKFVAPGVRPDVRIFARQAGGRALISIRDNGIGIPAESKAAIFDLFYRVDPRYEGTGIGLATVRRAVERMGGRITVESELGRGSTFTLDLALAEAAPAAAGRLSPEQTLT